MNTAGLTTLAAGDPALIRQAFWLWAGTAILGMVLILFVWWLATGWTRRARSQRTRPTRRGAVRDPWSEAGRRAATPDADDLEPDGLKPDDPEPDDPGEMR